MSLITIDQFEEFVEAHPEMEQCYAFRYDSETMDANDGWDWNDIDDPFFEALDWMDA